MLAICHTHPLQQASLNHVWCLKWGQTSRPTAVSASNGIAFNYHLLPAQKMLGTDARELQLVLCQLSQLGLTCMVAVSAVGSRQDQLQQAQ